tara:strand:+ start:72 stop:182 length:111 start_codon:yes stop_codon:yes gene_type:complete
MSKETERKKRVQIEWNKALDERLSERNTKKNKKNKK